MNLLARKNLRTVLLAVLFAVSLTACRQAREGDVVYLKCVPAEAPVSSPTPTPTVTPTPSVTPPPPTLGTPQNVQARAQGPDIVLTWAAVSGAERYTVERCKNAGCTNFAQISTPYVTTLTDETTNPAATYCYRVKARSASGAYGGYSVSVCAVI
jgi:hypothetical protein